MARPKRSSPSTRLTVVVDAAAAAELDRVAIQAAHETGKPILTAEVHRRGIRVLLAALASCRDCRAGTCTAEHVQAGPAPVEVPCDVPVEAPAPPATTVEDPAPVVEPLRLAPVEVAADAPANVPRRGRPKGAKNKPRVITEESPEHARLVKFYEEQFEAVRGEKPKWVTRDFAAFKALRERFGFDGSCNLIRNAFADAWWAKRVTIQKIVADPSTFVGNASQSISPKSTQDEPMPSGW